MKVKDAEVTVAVGAVTVLAGAVTYHLAKNSIQLRLAERRERKLKKDIANLQRQLDKDAMKMVIRFESV
jgi:NADP-dependent 3-hydroxy acid dehydrogenase YdfG